MEFRFRRWLRWIENHSHDLACHPSSYPHRTWLYNYSWWSLTDASLALVQDEFDIQSGFDVTLWAFRPGTPKRMPVSP